MVDRNIHSIYIYRRVFALDNSNGNIYSAKGASWPRVVNVSPVFLRAQLETSSTYRNILCQCPFGNGNDNAPHIVVVFIWYLLSSRDISRAVHICLMHATTLRRSAELPTATEGVIPNTRHILWIICFRNRGKKVYSHLFRYNWLSYLSFYYRSLGIIL